MLKTKSENIEDVVMLEIVSKEDGDYIGHNKINKTVTANSLNIGQKNTKITGKEKTVKSKDVTEEEKPLV